MVLDNLLGINLIFFFGSYLFCISLLHVGFTL